MIGTPQPGNGLNNASSNPMVGLLTQQNLIDRFRLGPVDLDVSSSRDGFCGGPHAIPLVATAHKSHENPFFLATQLTQRGKYISLQDEWSSMMHRSIKCSQCGFVGWADAENCKKCGASLIQASSDGPSSEAPYQPPQDYRYQASDRGGFNGEVKKGLAICALVIGIINLFTLGILGVGALVGIILSIVALVRIKRNPSQYGGTGMATAGLITSILSVLIIVPVGIIAAIAIPNLLASRRAANEGSAMQSMRQISMAEETYQSLHTKYGTLDQLAAAQLIKTDLATGARHGYKFTVELSTSDSPSQPGFHAVAMPIEYPSTGRRSFFMNESGVIRAADAQGAEATEFDPPLNVNFGDSSPSSSRDPGDRY